LTANIVLVYKVEHFLKSVLDIMMLNCIRHFIERPGDFRATSHQ